MMLDLLDDDVERSPGDDLPQHESEFHDAVFAARADPVAMQVLRSYAALLSDAAFDVLFGREDSGSPCSRNSR